SLARELARQGCKVGLLARRQAELSQLADEVRRAGGTAAFAVADVGDRAKTLAAVEEVRRQLGPIDLLVANAGVGVPTGLDPFNIGDVERTFRVNVLGVVYAIEAVLPDMLRRGRGPLSAVSSLGSFRGFPGESAYCASKAAVNIYLEGLRIQLRGRGIAVTTICPGFIRTPMTAVNKFPMPWLMDADEAAGRFVRARAWGRRGFNFPWQTPLLRKMASWLPAWVLARTIPRTDPHPPGRAVVG